MVNVAFGGWTMLAVRAARKAVRDRCVLLFGHRDGQGDLGVARGARSQGLGTRNKVQGRNVPRLLFIILAYGLDYFAK